MAPVASMCPPLARRLELLLLQSMLLPHLDLVQRTVKKGGEGGLVARWGGGARGPGDQVCVGRARGGMV